MYDYAGEWIYRVGMPAKSGVGGGIIAALPGTARRSARSRRGSTATATACAASRSARNLSSHFDLHVLNRSSDVRTSISPTTTSRTFIAPQPAAARAGYPRRPLPGHPRHRTDRRACTSPMTDYVSRRLAAARRGRIFLIIDLRRVPAVTEGARAPVRRHVARSGDDQRDDGAVRRREELGGLGSIGAADRRRPRCAASICSTRRSNGRKIR